MKKIFMVLMGVLLITGCGQQEKKNEVIEFYTCVDKNDELKAFVTLNLEFRDDKLYFMKQTQSIDYKTEAEAISEANLYDENSYMINDSFDHIKAYTKVEGKTVHLITEHEVSKFTQGEKDAMVLKENKKDVLLNNYKNNGFICEIEEK